jgi:pyridoxamine 5'-phosphate oxidase
LARYGYSAMTNPAPAKTRSHSGPLGVLSLWIEDARRSGVAEPEAMTLATVGLGGAPAARVVLCRGVDDRGLLFYTNYESRKGHELQAHSQAAAVFLWAALGRQARVEGHVTRLTAAESDAYFRARPRGHQISAWASPQSRVIGSLEEVRRRYEEIAKRFEGVEVPRPDYWGGYVLEARVVELWTSGAERLHDRVRYERKDNDWEASRLAP